MDREILFRGKPIQDIEETIVEIDNMDGFIYGNLLCPPNDDRAWIDIPYYGAIAIDRNTIGQFVGLCDKNGKKIFEGDIISDGSINTWTVKYGYTHIACCGCCYGYHDYIGFYFEDKYGEVDMYEEITKKIEVIGNIWDNKELLEKS